MTQPEFHPTVIIPHYNHSATIGKVVAELLALDLPVLIVDDGSSSEHQAVLKTLESDKVRLVFREKNGGKGAAVKTGLKKPLSWDLATPCKSMQTVSIIWQTWLKCLQNLGQIRPLAFAVNRFMARMRQKHGFMGGKSPTFGWR